MGFSGKSVHRYFFSISIHAFNDRTFSLGSAVFDLGNIYQSVGMVPGNASALFHIMQMPFSEIQKYATKINLRMFYKTLEVIDQASVLLSKSSPNISDGDLVKDEYNHTIRLLKHANKRGILALGGSNLNPADLDLDLREIMIAYQSIWLKRNRLGGLVDSLACFEKARLDYQK